MLNFGDVPELVSDRLILRRHVEADLDRAAAMWADPEVVRHIGGRPFTREEVWHRILRYIGHWSLRRYGYWAIHERMGDAFVGEIGLADWKRASVSLDLPEAGWVVSPAVQGRGYAKEAMALMLGWADATAVAATCCIIGSGNTRSIGLAECFGYSPSGAADAAVRIFTRSSRSGAAPKN